MSLVSGPNLLRLMLFAGLMLHKALWEVMKRDTTAPVSRPPSPGLVRRLVKTAKVVVLFFLVVQTLFLTVLPISDRPGDLQIAGTAIYLIGLATALLGRIQLGKNWKDVEDLGVAQQQSLATGGIYGYVRHPIYAGDMLLLIGLELALNSWLVLAMSVPILVFAQQAVAEEAVLARKFQDYEVYSKRTKRFIPFLI
jgi:protein-S-isoprenylcysteine O-methyltransferase Ste14